MQNLLDYINFGIAISGMTIAFMIIIFIIRMQFLDRLSKRFYLIMSIILFLFFVSCITIFIIKPAQMENCVLLLLLLACSISAMVLFLQVLNTIISVYKTQKHDIAEHDYKIKALQIRPHFIFNTLSNIYYLCELNPPKAQKVIDDFTIYLRKNINAVSKQELISFEEELSHTKAYVSVAKARYEDLLVVNYDTPLLNFKLPALTLEPLVENAVKHALDPDSDPLQIMIRTRLENSYNVIIVENTGADFPVESFNESRSSLVKDNDSHIGLDNIKSRLAFSCGGSLKLSKRPNGGTIATICIHADQSG